MGEYWGKFTDLSRSNYKGIRGGQISKVASQLGVSENDAAGGLADLLPKVIDNLTPNGQLPDGDLLAQGLNMLKGKLFG